MIFGDLRSRVDFEVTDCGDRSTESREFCKGDCVSESDLALTLFFLITLGVAGVIAFLGVSDIEDLLKFKF